MKNNHPQADDSASSGWSSADDFSKAPAHTVSSSDRPDTRQSHQTLSASGGSANNRQTAALPPFSAPLDDDDSDEEFFKPVGSSMSNVSTAMQRRRRCDLKQPLHCLTFD